MFEVGGIYVIEPDGDIYDDVRVEILVLNGDYADIKFLDGPLKGKTEDSWDVYYLDHISALELLAEQAE